MAEQQSNSGNRWYLKQHGLDAVFGPFKDSALIDFAMQGRMDVHTMVCSEIATKNQWVSAKRIPKLAAAMKEASEERLLHAETQAAVHKSKLYSYPTGASTTMMIGGIISIVTGIVHLLLGFLLFFHFSVAACCCS